jgi:hypothetical protein
VLYEFCSQIFVLVSISLKLMSSPDHLDERLCACNQNILLASTNKMFVIKQFCIYILSIKTCLGETHECK